MSTTAKYLICKAPCSEIATALKSMITNFKKSEVEYNENAEFFFIDFNECLAGLCTNKSWYATTGVLVSLEQMCDLLKNKQDSIKTTINGTEVYITENFVRIGVNTLTIEELKDILDYHQKLSKMKS